MKLLVIDASALVPPFLEEPHSADTERWLSRADEIHAPDLIHAEVGNVLWKRHRRGDVPAGYAAATAQRLRMMPLLVHSAFDLLPDALDIALRYDRSVYDCLYAALALRTGSVMVTADQRLANALADTPLAG